MLVFLTIALVGFVYVLISSVFGHAHDLGHEIAHDFGHGDSGGDHEGDGHITSIFSAKVIAIFLMGFGGMGGIARYYDYSYPASCLAGVVIGAIFGAIMFWIMEWMSKQQANSLVKTSSLVGFLGIVETAIDGNNPGEVSVSMDERYNVYIARSKGGRSIAKGKRVRVIETVGSELTVEEIL